MSIWLWTLIYLGHCGVCKWICSWGGAAMLEEWNEAWLTYLPGPSSSERDIKMGTFLVWAFMTVWFVIGVIAPEYRS